MRNIGMRKWFMSAAALAGIVLLAACGSNSSSSGDTSVQQPAFTDLAGTRWAIVDSVSSSNNSCGATTSDSDSWTGVVATQSGNSLSLYDTRAGSSKAIAGTISGYVVTFNGSRYPVGGCSSMTGSYTVTLNSAGTNFSGTATLTCLDNGCTVPTSVYGSKM